MKKFGAILFTTILLPLSAFSGHICEFEDFRAKYPGYCIGEEKDGFFGKSMEYKPSPALLKLVGGKKAYKKKFKKLGAANGGKDGTKLVQRFDELHLEAQRVIAMEKDAPELQRNIYQAAQAQLDAAKYKLEAEKLSESIDTTGSVQDAIGRIKKGKSAEDQAILDAMLKDADPSDPASIYTACNRQNREKCFSLVSEVQDEEDRLVAEKKAKSADKQKFSGLANDKINRLLGEISKAHSDEFKANALERIKKADPNLVGDADSITDACNNASKNSQSKAFKVCTELHTEIADVENAKAALKKARQDINDADGIHEILGLKLDLKGLQGKNREIARAALDKDIKKKLAGTELGRIMDQMRADMCAAALNPKVMCQENAALPENFINNSADVTKEVAEQFSGRVIGGSASQSEN